METPNFGAALFLLRRTRCESSPLKFACFARRHKSEDFHTQLWDWGCKLWFWDISKTNLKQDCEIISRSSANHWNSVNVLQPEDSWTPNLFYQVIHVTLTHDSCLSTTGFLKVNDFRDGLSQHKSLPTLSFLVSTNRDTNPKRDNPRPLVRTTCK